MLDTLKVSHDLRKAGFDEQQAEALVTVVRDANAFDVSDVATKSDLTVLKSDLLRAIAESNMVTKSDLLRAIAESNTTTKSDLLRAIAESNTTTKSELLRAIADPNTATKSELLRAVAKSNTATKSELLRAIAVSSTDTLKWVIGMIMGSVLINVATMIALVKLLGH